MRKCSFLDCQNATIDNKENFCATCQNRPEQKQCDACGKPEPQAEKILISQKDILLRTKLGYPVAQKLRSKFPSHLQTQIDLLLPDLKLSAEETNLVTKLETLITNFLTSKGGKQHQIDSFQLCSVCNPEIVELSEEFLKQNPNTKTFFDRIKEAQEKIGDIVEEFKKTASEDEWEAIITEINEETYGKAETQTPPEIPNPPPTSKTCDFCGKKITNRGGVFKSKDSTGRELEYCSQACQKGQQNQKEEEIILLQQEINSLKWEIEGLKNPRNPTPVDPNLLKEKEQQIKDKEEELEKKKREFEKGKKQLRQDNKSPWPALLITFGIGGGVIFIIVLVVFIQKKKKNGFKYHSR